MRHASLLFLLFALAAGCSGNDASAIPESKLPDLVLQSDDLPPVWSQFDDGRQVRADRPSGRRADPTRFERRGGWKARFRRPGTPSTPGPLVIESRADLFSHVAGAKRDFELLEQDLDATFAGSARELDDPDLGQEARAAEFAQGTGPATVRFYSVAWRHDNVVAAILANGFARSLEFEDVLRLAREQDERIANAAGD